MGQEISQPEKEAQQPTEETTKAPSLRAESEPLDLNTEEATITSEVAKRESRDDDEPSRDGDESTPECIELTRAAVLDHEKVASESPPAAQPPFLTLNMMRNKRDPSSNSSSSSRSTESSSRSSFFSWRPSSLTGVASRKKRKHKDPKKVMEGLEELSLHSALGQPMQVKRLIDSGQEVNQRDFDGDRLPLHWAAARGEVRCIELLLNAGADVRILDAEGRTAADLAQLSGQSMAFNVLSFGASTPDPKRVYEGLNPVSVGAALNEPSIVKQSIAVDPAAVATRDSDGDRYPLHWAAARGSVRCVKLLLDAGASASALDAAGRTAVALASEQGQHAVVDLLASEAGTERGTQSMKVMELAMARKLSGSTVSERLSSGHPAELHLPPAEKRSKPSATPRSESPTDIVRQIL